MSQFSQILRYLEKNWNIGKDMNGKPLDKFLSAEESDKWKYKQIC